MKTLRILFSAAALIAAFSCNKEMQEPQVNQEPEVAKSELIPMTFTATTTETRTTLDGVSINWLSTDIISVFDGEGNREFTSSGEGATVQFSGEASQAANYYALYPYNEGASFNEANLTASTTLAANQTPTAGTFANGLNINASKSTDNTTFHFTNVLSVAKFTLSGSNLGGKTIKSVKFGSTYPLAGDVVIAYGEAITASAGSNTVNEITLANEDGSALTDGTYYFVVLPNPGGAITMTFEATDGCTASVSASLGSAFSAGVIKNLGTVGGLVWTNKYSIVFGNNVNSANPISGTTKASTVISSGTDYVTTQPFTVEGNAYYGDTKTCIRLGKTSAISATLSIDLADAGKVSVKQIIINCKQYNSSHAGTLSVNGATAQAVPAEAGDLTYSFNDVLFDKIVLSVSDVTYIYSIDVDYVVKTPVTLSFGEQTTFNIAQGDSFTPPTLTTDPAGLAVTYSSSDEDVATVDANTGSITLEGGIGSTTITATFAGDDTYSSGSAKYTLIVSRAISTTIAQLKQDLGTSTESMQFTANLTNAVITRTYGNYYAWIQDETAGMFISCAAAEDLAQGDSFTGTITGTMKVSRNQPLINDIDVSNATKTTGVSVAPVDVTIADLTGSMASYDGKLCRIRKARAGSNLATGENKSILIYQGEDRMDLFTRASFAANSIVANNYYDIIGMPSRFDDKYEIIVASTEDVTEASINWVLSSISVKTAPTKTSYFVGEYFDPSGLVLSTVEKDSDLEYVTRAGEDVTYSASDNYFSFTPSLTTPLEESNTSVQITYKGKSSTQAITVIDSSSPGTVPANTVLFSENWGSASSSIANYDGSGASSYNNASTITYSTTDANAKIDTQSGISNMTSAHLYINGNKNAAGYTVTIAGIKAYGAKKVRVIFACNNTSTTVGIVESSSGEVKSANSSNNTGDFVLSGTEETITLKIYNNAKANTRSDDFKVIFLE